MKLPQQHPSVGSEDVLTPLVGSPDLPRAAAGSVHTQPWSMPGALGTQTASQGHHSAPAGPQTIGSASLLGWGHHLHSATRLGVLGLRLEHLPGVLQGIGGGELAPAPRHFQASRAAPGSCTIHSLPGYLTCSCLVGGRVHSSWASLDLYRAFPLVNTHSQQRNKGGMERGCWYVGFPKSVGG